jgi:hypothetical protein
MPSLARSVSRSQKKMELHKDERYLAVFRREERLVFENKKSSQEVLGKWWI